MLSVTDLSKEYPSPAGSLPVLSGVSFELQRGESMAVMGPSGSGKSTLLYIIGTLDTPSSGTVTLDNENAAALSERDQARFRNRHIGFVFQDHCLLPQCTVLENVLVPTLVAEPGPYTERARALLDQVGLGARLDHKPAQLSGGEKQRVAIARALIREPLLLLCDEPTGNLDRKSSETVGALLRDLHQRLKTILIVVTHSTDLAGQFPARFEIRDRGLSRL